MTHTPGPWVQMGDEIYGADGTRIAEAVTMRDVLLLTALPDLLHAARQALAVLEALDEGEMARLRGRADTAIASLRAVLKGGGSTQPSDADLLALAYSPEHVDVFSPVGGDAPVLKLLRAAGELFARAARPALPVNGEA